MILLVNALYFNGYWLKTFDAKNTKAGEFTGTRGVKIQTQFMENTEEFFFREEPSLDAKILRLPYKVRSS